MSDEPPIDRMVGISAAMERMLARMEATYASVDGAAIGRLEAGQAAVHAEIAGLRTEFLAEIGGMRTEFPAQIAGLRTEFPAQIAGLRTEFLAQIADMRTEFLAQIAGLRTDFPFEIANLRSEFLAKIASLRTDFLAEIGSRSADIMGKILELRADVTHIRDDIAVNMGAVDQVERINENTRSDVRQMREQMSVMWKQLKQAQEDIRTLKGTS